MELGGGTITTTRQQDMSAIPLREAFARANTALAQLGVTPAPLTWSAMHVPLVMAQQQAGLLHYTIADAKSCRDDHLGA